MKLIFLDIDGVLVTERSMRRNKDARTFDIGPLELFLRTLRETNANIVISSTWRFGMMKELKAGPFGHRIIGHTPFQSEPMNKIQLGSRRDDEILKFLQGLGPLMDLMWCAIDDDSHDMTKIGRHLVQTDFATGFEQKHADQVKKLLLEDYVWPDFTS